MACRMPGADCPEAFWRLIAAGESALGPLPRGRWPWLDTRDAGERATAIAGTLERVAGFDARLFGMGEWEADRTDPQQRLLLEAAWEAVDDAGLDLARLAGTGVGVFVGISNADFGLARIASSAGFDAYTALGATPSIAANRISFCFDWRGPSIAVDTACSSSLTALHLAAQALRSGEAALAVVGAVNLIMAPSVSQVMHELGALSPSGACRPFDARADGYVRGEGVGAVVLKALDAALADGDRIYAVLEGSAINHNGATNGMTAPRPHAQEAAIRGAADDAGVNLADVQLVEAHGTGTVLGDRVEALALSRVLGACEPPVALGAVKANVGHLEPAAGMAGLIKVCLALRARTLPPTAQCDEPSAHLPGSVRVLARAEAWAAPPSGAPRRAGLSSFGFGGANGHAILAEAPPRTPRVARAGEPELLVVSAHTPSALRTRLRDLAGWIASGRIAALADLAHTLCERRTHLAFRTGFVVDTLEEAGRLIAESAERALEPATRAAPKPPKVALLFDRDPERTVRAASAFAELVAPFRSLWSPPGDAAAAEQAFAAFWDRAGLALREPPDRVASAAAIAACLARGDRVIVVGGAPAIEGAVAGDPANRRALLETLRALYTWGARLAWHAFGGAVTSGAAIELPRFPFEPRDFALVPPDVGPRLEAEWSRTLRSVRRSAPRRVLEGVRLRLPTRESVFELELGTAVWNLLPVRSDGAAVAPPGWFVELAHAVAAQVVDSAEITLEALEVTAPLVVAAPGARIVHTVVTEQAGGFLARVASIAVAPEGAAGEDEFTTHATFRIRAGSTASATPAPLGRRVLELVAGDGADAGARAGADERARGALTRTWPLADGVLGLVESHRARPGELHVPPDLAEGCLELARLAAGAPGVARSIAAVTAPRPLPAQVLCRAAVDARTGAVDLDLFALDGTPLGRLRGVRHEAAAGVAEHAPYRAYDVSWRPAARLAAVPGGAFVVTGDRGGVQRACDAVRAVGRAAIPVADLAELTELGRASQGAGHDLAGVVLVAPASAPDDDAGRAEERALADLFSAVQAIARWPRRARLWIVTRGANGAGLHGASWTGFGRTVAQELPELWGGACDLAEDEPRAWLAAAAAWASERCPATLSWHDGRLHVPRIAPAALGGGMTDLASGGEVLVAGATGALGIELAAWLLDRGARALHLLARRPPDEAVRRRLEDLAAGRGARLRWSAVDLADLERARAELAPHLGVLVGVVHAAGVLDDRTLQSATWDQIARVARAKLTGAWNLHRLTLGAPSLASFVLFSSAASLFPAPGQAAYAAGNAFLDALARYRRARGLPATSIRWGPWAGRGMATTVDDARWAAVGVRRLAPPRALATLERLWGARGDAIVVDVDFARFAEAAADPSWFEDVRPAHAAPAAVATELAAQLRGLTARRRRLALADYTRAAVADLLSVEPAALDDRVPLAELGIGSAAATALRQRAMQELGIQIPATVVFSNPTISALAEVFDARIAAPDAAGPSPPDRGEPDELVEAIDAMSEQEAEAWLRRS